MAPRTDDPDDDRDRGRSANFYDPRTGDEPLRVGDLALAGAVELPRTNCFVVHRIDAGQGTVHIDDAMFSFGPR